MTSSRLSFAAFAALAVSAMGFAGCPSPTTPPPVEAPTCHGATPTAPAFARALSPRLTQLAAGRDFTGAGDCMNVDIDGAEVTPANTYATCVGAFHADGSTAWTRTVELSGGVFGAPSTAVDANGNVFVAVAVSGAADFGFGAIAAPPPGTFVAMLASYDARGAAVFQAALDGAAPLGVTVDVRRANHVATLTAVAETPPSVTLASHGAGGSVRWSKTLSHMAAACTDGGCGTQLVTADDGSLIFAVHAVEANPSLVSIGGPVVTAAADAVLVIAVDVDGAFRWVTPVSPAVDNAHVTHFPNIGGLAVDCAGNVFVSTAVDGTVAFGDTSVTTTSTVHSPSVFAPVPTLAALDVSSGAVRFVRVLEAQGAELGFEPSAPGIGVDADGSVLLAGPSAGALDFGAGPVTCADGWVARLDATGHLVGSACVPQTHPFAVAGAGPSRVVVAGNLLSASVTFEGTSIGGLGTGSFLVSLPLPRAADAASTR